MKKTLTRRKLIKNGIKAGITIPFLSYNLISCSPKKESETSEENNAKNASPDLASGKLKILILGGTSFLGPHQIAYALSRGHSVSTFTRGKTKPTVHQELFSQVEQLVGDRENNLTALENGKWDVVIDNSGRNVEWTKNSAALLKDKAELYLYTSSTGVYFPYLSDNISEETKLVLEVPEGIEDETLNMVYGYGVMKANSELAAIQEFGEDRSIIVRPTYMIGPADKTDRFIYWPIRLSRGGEIMIPGKRTDAVQYIDVRDVAEWMIRLAEEKTTGTFNAVGPKNPQTMNEFVRYGSTAFDMESSFVNIDDYDFLNDNDVLYAVPWIMPEGEEIGSAKINNKKALAAGLTLRNAKDSIIDTYNWWTSDALTQERRDKYELNPESLLMREKSIIEKWKK